LIQIEKVVDTFQVQAQVQIQVQPVMLTAFRGQRLIFELELALELEFEKKLNKYGKENLHATRPKSQYTKIQSSTNGL